MKTEKNILIAFLLNFAFSIFEFMGGIFTGSVAIISDAIHDIGDALSIGGAFFLEKKSKKKADEKYSFGYARYSVLGSVITTLILLFSSIIVIYCSIRRIIIPTKINYNGMIVFAIVGVFVNFIAAIFTREGDSLNQKAVNLHMLEDVLGWIILLVGALVMRFTNYYFIDPLLSIGVSAFILVHAIGNLKQSLALFLLKTPQGVDIDKIKKLVSEIEEVLEVRNMRVFSIDGYKHYAVMHVVANGNAQEIKENIRKKLQEWGIENATIEFENEKETPKELHSLAKTCKHHHH